MSIEAALFCLIINKDLSKIENIKATGCRLKLEERKLDIDEYDKREARQLQCEQLKLDSQRLDLHEHAFFINCNNNGLQPQFGPKQLKVRRTRTKLSGHIAEQILKKL